MITAQQEDQLINAGECYLHYHPDDRQPTHDTLNRLQNLAAPQATAVSKTLSYENDYIECSATCTITFPQARAGKEFEVINIGSGTVTVLPTSPDTLVGDTSVVIEQQWTALRFKAVPGGWVLI